MTAPVAPANYKPLIGLGIAVTAGIVATLVLARQSPSGAVTDSATALPDTAVFHPASNLVTLRLEAKRQEATLFLDDAELSSNPFTGKFPNDKRSHRIRAQAPGWSAKAVVVTFDKDVVMSLDLEALPTAGAAASVDTQPPAKDVAAPPGRRPPAGAKGPTKVRLDNTDPWQR